MEFDIVDQNNMLGEAGKCDYTATTYGFPDTVKAYYDLEWDDSTNTMSALIPRPDQFQSGKIYQIVFKPNNVRKSSGIIHLNIQLSVNYKYLAAMRNGFSSSCDILDLMGDMHGMSIDSVHHLITSNFGDVPTSAIDGWYYFLATNTDAMNNMQIRLNDGAEEVICWNDEKDPEHKDSGLSLCFNKNDLSIFDLCVGDDFYSSIPTCNSQGQVKGAQDSVSGDYNGSLNTNNPPSPTPQPIIQQLPDLRLYEMKVYRGDTLLKSGVNQSQAGEVLATENRIVSEKANCTNGTTVKNIKSTVEVQIGDGAWKVFDTVLTQPSTLTKDNPHKETSHYTIPEEARGKMLRFRIRVDSGNDVKETNEGNNLSDPNNERYPIVGDYNLIIVNGALTNGLSTVYQNSIGRVRYDVVNMGKDTPLSSKGIRSLVEVLRPGEANYSKIAEDGSDSYELSPGRLQGESTSQDGFSFNLPDIWSFRVQADVYNSLIESNETDNAYSFTVNVVPDNRKAIITILKAKLEEGSSVKKDTRVHPECEVQNIGDAYPAGPLIIDYLIDGKRRDGDTIQASELGPGVKKAEKVNNNNIRLGDKGNRTLTVTVKINGIEVARKDYKFKVK